MAQGAPLVLILVDNVLSKKSPFAFADLNEIGERPGSVPLVKFPLYVILDTFDRAPRSINLL